MPRAAGGGAKKSAPKAHKLAEQFPKGSILKDLFKKEWLLGDVVGKGGFGLIYLASEKDSGSLKGSETNHVIKIEPKDNGPLFCEMQFYQRVAKLDQIQAFTRKHKLQYLPVPPFIGTGSHEYKSNEYRFLVMPRYGTDLQKLLVQAGGTFPAKAVFAIGLRTLDALQYMHGMEYVHADVKAANILQGYQGAIVPNQVYLVDYGLAYRYTVDGVHKEYKEDPRKAHDGTIEFTSRDAHKGVSPSRRADLEILGYCLLQWLCGKLPWENKLTDPNYVADNKEKYMQNIPSLMSACFPGAANPNSVYADTMSKFLDIVKKLKYDEAPNYQRLKALLREGLTKTGHKNEWTIDLVAPEAKGSKRKSTEGTQKASQSPVKKARTTPSASPLPKKTATPKKRTPKIVTPMTSQSPAKSPTVAAAKSRASAKSTKSSKKDSSTVSRTKGSKLNTPLTRGPSGKSSTAASKSKSPQLDTPLTKHLLPNGEGDSGQQGRHVQKHFPMPAPSEPTQRSSAAKNPTRRRVKRVAVVKSDACIQTSPGFGKRR